MQVGTDRCPDGKDESMTKTTTNRVAGVGERIHVRLTLTEEALGMSPADPEVYSRFRLPSHRGRSALLLGLPD